MEKLAIVNTCFLTRSGAVFWALPNCLAKRLGGIAISIKRQTNWVKNDQANLLLWGLGVQFLRCLIDIAIPP